MASNIYGELIKAQLQNSASDLTPVSTGLIYFNTTTGLKWYDSASWRIAADLDSSQTLFNKEISSTSLITGALIVPRGTTGERPGTPLNAMIRYNTTDGAFEGYQAGAWSPIGGGASGVLTVAQASHGFVVGDAIYLNGSSYAKAKADAANTAEVLGIVSTVIDANSFKFTAYGSISGLSGLTSGSNYFLSPSVAGQLTATEPTTVGHVSVPVMVATSATTAVINIMRGVVVGGSNVRTSIALANNATTTIQSLAAYEAAELTGWVSISATTPLKFYVQAQAAKNGAGTDWNLSYQTTGDTPPVGFSVTVTAAGLVQVTLPSLAGFTAASINFALNAPAVGTTFPLNVDYSSVSMSGTGNGLFYQQQNVTLSMTGGTATVNFTAYVTRIGRVVTVTHDAPGNVTKNASAGFFTITGMPTWAYPGGANVFSAFYEITNAQSGCDISSGGIITVYRGFGITGYNNFAASTAYNFNKMGSFTYSV